MAGRGPAPKQSGRRTHHAPTRGGWRPSPGDGWQHGRIPTAPGGLGAVARKAWDTWFRAWWASNWTPSYLPQIRMAIQILDQCQRAIDDPFIEVEGPAGRVSYVPRPNPTAELRQWMDQIGASYKGQQDRRWAPPKADAAMVAGPAAPSPYAHLRVVGEAAG